MKITNKHNLPEAVFNALSKSSYNAGESTYSVTTLLKPPQMVALERMYHDQLEEDVMDRVWSLFGSACHTILEGHSHDESLAEQRLYVDVLGEKIGGQVDNYHEGIITDYKVTSAWTLVYGSRLSEWEEQLNLYAYIFRQNGYEVNHLQIVAILRDWEEKKALADKNYPQTPIQIIPLNVWDEDRQYRFIDERTNLHKLCQGLSPQEINNNLCCSPEETWEQESTWAVMKQGATRATRVCSSEIDAQNYIDSLVATTGSNQESRNEKLQNQFSVVERKGSRTRCEKYCKVRDYCIQYQRYKEESCQG